MRHRRRVTCIEDEEARERCGCASDGRHSGLGRASLAICWRAFSGWQRAASSKYCRRSHRRQAGNTPMKIDLGENSVSPGRMKIAWLSLSRYGR